MNMLAIIGLLRKISFSHLFFGGWENPSSLIIPFFTSKSKNCILCESSVYEYKPHLVKDTFKRLFLKRMSIGFPSGIAQEKLLQTLGYKGKIIYTGGCGILNYQPQPEYNVRNTVKNFLFVGRLIDCKNLKLLVSAFNELPELNLTIIGFGAEEKELRSMSKSNIKFLGAVENKDLGEYYKSADVLVLPSKSETWGLVVEEALNNGTPVVVSDVVGCRDDLVTKETGLVFEHSSVESLKHALCKITELDYYNFLRKGVSKLDFQARARQQIMAFVNM